MNEQSDRQTIIDRYMQRVHGKRPDTAGFTEGHDGKEGHWLEIQMGIDPNGTNDADIFGYEMKNDTTSKTTFGDWSADYYIFADEKYDISRDDFLKIFGHPNPKKPGRHSWSGAPIPRIDRVNTYGQMLVVDNDKNVIATYSYSEDQREDKASIVPPKFQVDDLVIAQWDRDSLKAKLERKFNKKGWFKCMKDSDGKYHSIVFGSPINYDTWIAHVSNGDIFFDSGMYTGNPRHYSQWRANNSLWDKMVTDRFP